METNFDLIKNMDLETLATYLHNIQESAIILKEANTIAFWETFLNKKRPKSNDIQ